MLVLIKQLEDQRVGQGGAGGRRVERLAEGVVSVEWRLLDAAEEAPRVHLHVGDGTKAPVDLAFDAKDGRLLSAQVVLQDEAVGERHVFGGELPREPGVPLADVTPWHDEEQIVNDHEDEDELDGLASLTRSPMSPPIQPR